MISSILILTDFSANAGHAVNYAKLLTKAWNLSRMDILHVLEPAGSLINIGGDALGIDNFPTIENELVMDQWQSLKENNHHLLQQLATDLKKDLPEKTRVTASQETGFFINTVNEYVETHQIDLVILGISGKNNFTQKLIGSNAMDALHHITQPVIIIPATAEEKIPKKAAFSSDLKFLGAMGLTQLKQLMEYFSQPMELINVISEPLDDSLKQQLKDDFIEQLSPLNAAFHFITADTVQQGIENYVSNHQIDLLIFTYHEKGFFRRLFHKSNSREIIWNSHIPLLRIWDENV